MEPLSDSVDGFARFYELLYSRALPRHALEDWVEPLYAARADGKGLVVEAFRGSSKTTTLTVAFTAFRLGQEPHKSALLIQAGDRMAASTSMQIADLIEHNPGWSAAFPDVRPDRSIQWGGRGYELLNHEFEYSEWRAMCAREKGKDPTFVALGYRSSAIIGKHPTGILVIDDIHDEGNTRSGRELERVLDIVQGTIMPTAMPEAWQLFVGTPWTRKDVLATLKATGRFLSMSTPIYKSASRAKVPQQLHADSFWLDKEPTWPEKFPVEQVDKARQLAGEKQFARMYLLDLSAAEGIHLKSEWLAEFPHERVEPSWPVVIGVDYASTSGFARGGRRDYFAVAIGRTIPNGGVVLIDGFRAQVSQGEAEQKLRALAANYPTLRLIGVEAIGKGEEFYNLLLRDAFLPVVPMHTGRADKAERFEGGMAKLFQFGRAWVTNVETAFLRAFREEWARWPQGDHDDTLDAVYWMLRAAEGELYTGRKRSKQANPLASFGRG